VTLARKLVQALRTLAKEPLPDDISSAARLHLLDSIGVGLAAAASDVGSHYIKFAREMTYGGAASVFGMPTGASAADAALVNGGLIHSLEYDDTHTASIVHGSAVLAPTAIAVGEERGMPGEQVLGAYARGWDVLVRFGLAAPGGFQARGFQVTSVGGALVAALIASDLANLSENETVSAIGIALSQASGVFEFLTNGSTVKSLHPGWAAHSGTLAARLAHAGMTGPETSLEGRFGLFRAFAGDGTAAERFQSLLSDIGRTWYLPEAAFKFNACCHYLHPFVEAAGEIAARGVPVNMIARILCRVPAGAAPIICEPWALKLAPEIPHAARWSLPAVVAARLIEGKIDLATFEEPASDAVRSFASRIAWEPLMADRFPDQFEAEIMCELTDGTTHSVRIPDVYGNKTRPATDAEVRRKFRANARMTLLPGAVSQLETAVNELSDAESLAHLTAALRAARTESRGSV
jgi:2-methylcitrate dehydratase PrpD